MNPIVVGEWLLYVVLVGLILGNPALAGIGFVAKAVPKGKGEGVRSCYLFLLGHKLPWAANLRTAFHNLIS